MAANTEVVLVDIVEKSTWEAILALTDNATALVTLATKAEALTELAENADELLALLDDGTNTEP